MRLRKAIKRPQRFEDSEVYASKDQRPHPTKPAFPELLAAQVVPFDPNAPPAAFPSLPLSHNPTAHAKCNADASHSTHDECGSENIAAFEDVDQRGYANEIDWQNSNDLIGTNIAMDNEHICGNRALDATSLNALFPLSITYEMESSPEPADHRDISEVETSWTSLGLAMQLEIYNNMRKSYTASEIHYILQLSEEQAFMIEQEYDLSQSQPLDEEILHRKTNEEFMKGLRDRIELPSHSDTMAKHIKDFVREGHLYHPYVYEISRARSFLGKRSLDIALAGRWEIDKRNKLVSQKPCNIRSLQPSVNKVATPSMIDQGISTSRDQKNIGGACANGFDCTQATINLDCETMTPIERSHPSPDPSADQQQMELENMMSLPAIGNIMTTIDVLLQQTQNETLAARKGLRGGQGANPILPAEADLVPAVHAHPPAIVPASLLYPSPQQHPRPPPHDLRLKLNSSGEAVLRKGKPHRTRKASDQLSPADASFGSPMEPQRSLEFDAASAYPQTPLPIKRTKLATPLESPKEKSQLKVGRDVVDIANEDSLTRHTSNSTQSYSRRVDTVDPVPMVPTVSTGTGLATESAGRSRRMSMLEIFTDPKEISPTRLKTVATDMSNGFPCTHRPDMVQISDTDQILSDSEVQRSTTPLNHSHPVNISQGAIPLTAPQTPLATSGNELSVPLSSKSKRLIELASRPNDIQTPPPTSPPRPDEQDKDAPTLLNAIANGKHIKINHQQIQETDSTTTEAGKPKTGQKAPVSRKKKDITSGAEGLNADSDAKRPSRDKPQGIDRRGTKKTGSTDNIATGISQPQSVQPQVAKVAETPRTEYDESRTAEQSKKDTAQDGPRADDLRSKSDTIQQTHAETTTATQKPAKEQYGRLQRKDAGKKRGLYKKTRERLAKEAAEKAVQSSGGEMGGDNDKEMTAL